MLPAQLNIDGQQDTHSADEREVGHAEGGTRAQLESRGVEHDRFCQSHDDFGARLTGELGADRNIDGSDSSSASQTPGENAFGMSKLRMETTCGNAQETRTSGWLLDSPIAVSMLTAAHVSSRIRMEPLHSELVHPLTTENRTRLRGEHEQREELASGSKLRSDLEWYRDGTFCFNVSIYTPNKRNLIAQKEAPGYNFSHTDRNWGWSRFCSRDRIYFDNPAVREVDAVVITVSLTSSPFQRQAIVSNPLRCPKDL
ncbi:hypothetical protein U1Q18_044764 [Sarracenia purpurea var. burkii]